MTPLMTPLMTQPLPLRERDNVFQFGGFVLVGGRSSRMGRSKALLESDSRPLALRAADLLSPLVAEVTLLGPPATYAQLGLPVLPDELPDLGPLSALCTALRNSAYDWNIFLACDLPLLERGVLAALTDRVRSISGAGEIQAGVQAGVQAVVPRTDGWQPLCAAYHRSCLPAMEAALSGNRRSVAGVLPRLRVEALTTHHLGDSAFCARVFRNVNTPQEWLETQPLMGATI